MLHIFRSISLDSSNSDKGLIRSPSDKKSTRRLFATLLQRLLSKSRALWYNSIILEGQNLELATREYRFPRTGLRLLGEKKLSAETHSTARNSFPDGDHSFSTLSLNDSAVESFLALAEVEQGHKCCSKPYFQLISSLFHQFYLINEEKVKNS